MNRTTLHCLLLAAAAATGAAGAAPLSFTVGNMAAAQWSQTVLRHQGPASVAVALSSAPNDAADSAWLTTFDIARSFGPGSSADVVANIHLAQRYDPALRGALDRVEIGFDVLGLSSTLGGGATAFLRPLIEQGGQFFSVLGSSLLVSVGTAFVPLTWQFEDDANWSSLVGNARPDFSAAGAPIHFGYRWDLGTNCSSSAGCLAAATRVLVDDLRVSAFAVAPPVGALPTPGSLALGFVALGAAGLSRRRR